MPDVDRPAPAGRRTLRIVLVGALTLVLVGGPAAASLAWYESRLDASAETVEARGRLAAAAAGLAMVAVPARGLLRTSEGRVADERTRDELAEALASAAAATRTAATSVHELDEAAARVAQAREEVEAAAGVVDGSTVRWELDRAQGAYDEAAGELDTALGAARAVLDASAGRVADDAVRQALGAAVAAARAIYDGAAPRDVAGLTGRAGELSDAARFLAAHSAEVDAAVVAWEAARAAAEAAAREAADRGTARSSTKPAQPSGNQGSATTGGPSEQYHWEETVTYDDSFTVCGDTEGNSWFC